MDFIILLLEKKICKKKASLTRIFFGASCGALLTCIIVIVPQFNYIVYLCISYFFSSGIIVFVTFRTKKILELMKLTVMLYIIAIILGGIIFALYYYANVGYGLNTIIQENIAVNIDFQLLLVFIFIAIVLFTIFYNLYTKIATVSKNIFDTVLCYNNFEIKVNALLDTGNNLYDPITNLPVIIGEADLLKHFFTEDKFHMITNSLESKDDISKIENIRKISGANIRLIPYTSVGNENGMLIGFVLDKLIIKKGREEKINKNVVIAIYNNKLSKDNSYNILLHPKLI
jgi:stage II sporulation protein GA (sporulation sigma-E factor processing peptidase)